MTAPARRALPAALLVPALALLGAAATARAQHDERDRVTKHDGRVVTGRVVEPFATGEIVVLQGGKRVRVDAKDVAALDLVGARVKAFCERRVKQKDSVRAQQFLVDQAAADGLMGLARLQATWLALRDDGDEKAHLFLGHERSGKGWLWPHDGRKLTLEQLEQAMLKDPVVLRGERFTLRCDAGLQTNVEALLDLEHLGAAWYDRFGADLQLREVLDPIDVVAFRNAELFPKWGFRPLPYYVPPPHGDEARTFYFGPAPTRPERLFFVGTQGLLYRSLIGEVGQQSDRDRVCPWLEVGLGMLMESVMQGPAGFATPGKPAAQDMQAFVALGRTYRLTHLLHLPMYGSFYLTEDRETTVNWNAAGALVAWLLEEGNQPDTRAPFLRFVRAALRERKGDSSSAFDRVFGRRIEDLEQPWREWLAKTAGG